MVKANLKKGAKILLVEDSMADQRLIARAVRKTEFKAELFIVNDGEEAMAFLQHQPPFEDIIQHPRPDIILLDINMPKMDGKQVLKAVRQDPKLHNLPIIMLTTSDNEKDVLESYQLGVNAYITKPSGLDSFISTIQTLELFWLKLVELPSS